MQRASSFVRNVTDPLFEIYNMNAEAKKMRKEEGRRDGTSFKTRKESQKSGQDAYYTTKAEKGYVSKNKNEYAVLHDGTDVDPYLYANANNDNFPCESYQDKDYTEDKVGYGGSYDCVTKDINWAMNLKNFILDEKKRALFYKPNWVILHLLEQARVVTDTKHGRNSFFSNEDSIPLSEINLTIKNFIILYRELMVVDSDILDVGLLGDIVNELDKFKRNANAKWARTFLMEARKQAAGVSSRVFRLEMQNAQGSEEFVEEFTRKMIRRGYDPNSSNGKLKLTCEKIQGRKRPFAYQIPVPAIIRPENSTVTKMLVLHRTGAGKTDVILKLMNNFFHDVRPKFFLCPKINVRDNFYQELMTTTTPWNLFQMYAVERFFSYIYNEGKLHFGTEKNSRAKNYEKIRILYTNKVVKNDYDLIIQAYGNNPEIEKNVRLKIMKCVKNILAGEDHLWQKTMAQTGKEQDCSSNVMRLNYLGEVIGCLRHFPASPLRALYFAEAATELYSSDKPAGKTGLAPIVKLPKFYDKDMPRIDYKSPKGIGAPGDEAVINHIGSDKILILDEIHVLMKPDPGDFNVKQRNKYLPRLEKKIRQAKNSVVVGLTATPIFEANQEHVDKIMSMIKGNENIDRGNYGFVSFMNTAPSEIYPRVIPGEISLGKIVCVNLQGSNLNLCKKQHKDKDNIKKLNNDKTRDKKLAQLQNYCNLDEYCVQAGGQKKFKEQIKRINKLEKLDEWAENHATKLLKICKEIMKKQVKTLVLIEEKMCLYPLARLLEKRVALCDGVECFPKYCENGVKEGGCFIEMWKATPNPTGIKKTIFRNGAELTNSNQDALAVFNDNANLRGEKIMCIIADARAFTESTSFGQVRRLILANPALSWVNHKQRIGRVLRACIYAPLEEAEREVEIISYVSKANDFDTADVIAFKRLGYDMHAIEELMQKSFENYAIDKQLLAPLIGKVPDPIDPPTLEECMG